MAEALAAVGVASSILQIVDFGARVIKCTYALMTASQDELREEIRLEKIIKEQDAVTARLRASLNSRSILTANERAAISLSQEAKNETVALLHLLKEFKLESSENFTRRTIRSVKIALEIKQIRARVEARRNNLQLVNGQLATALLLVLSDQNGTESRAILDLQQRLDDKTKDVVNEILQMRVELTSCLSKREDQRRESLRQVLSSLHFPDMQSRRNSIDEAFPKTYEWALEHDTSGIKTWLRTGSGIYWVAGKAGSGKSTLMKFLGNDNRTLEYLSEWSASREETIRVQCYFWYLGSTLQRSVEGLLRTILHQILCACPEVVKTLLPERWARTEHYFAPQDSWELKELRSALQRVIHALSQANALAGLNRAPKICILVDGLDEHNGNHGELVQILELLAADERMKLCVSSRPWNVFVRVYESHKPHLYLQDLTGNDMRIYVGGKLRNALFMLRSSIGEVLPSSEADIVSITHDILRQAEGVFLWVRLAVQSVLRGLDEGDNTATLRKRVLEYPSDLDKFFDCILARIDSVYQFQTSQALYLAYLYAEGHDGAAARSSYLDFELLGRSSVGLADTQYLWDLRPQGLSTYDFMHLVCKTRSFLGACCKDFLIVSLPRGNDVRTCARDPSKLKVQFLHRTVFEYLKASGYAKRLEQEVPQCLRDGSAFHLLNMGKLTMFLNDEPNGSSDHFLQQVNFSLGHHWPGLDIPYIDRLHRLQALHEPLLCTSIGVAYLAFEENDKFRRGFLEYYPSPTSVPICRFRADRSWDHNPNAPIYEGMETLDGSNDPTPEEHACVPRETQDKNAARFYPQLLAACVGMARCKSFSQERVDVRTLADILESGADAKVTSFDRTICTMLRRFLRPALESLYNASLRASTDLEHRTNFFKSRSIRHMHDVLQTLDHADSHAISRVFADGSIFLSKSNRLRKLFQARRNALSVNLIAGDAESGVVDPAHNEPLFEPVEWQSISGEVWSSEQKAFAATVAIGRVPSVDVAGGAGGQITSIDDDGSNNPSNRQCAGNLKRAADGTLIPFATLPSTSITSDDVSELSNPAVHETAPRKKART